VSDKYHRRRKRGYAWDLTPQLFWGIFYMCISLKITYPCKLYATRTEMLEKAIWRLHRIQENPSADGAPPLIPLGEVTALPQTPYLVGRAGYSLPKNHIPNLGPRLSYVPPLQKLVPTLLTNV